MNTKKDYCDFLPSWLKSLLVWFALGVIFGGVVTLLSSCSNGSPLAPTVEPWTPTVVQRDVGGFVDFALVEDDGTFHIIGIDGNQGGWIEPGYQSIGFVHMTSTDMKHWTEGDNIIDPLYNHEFSQDHVWAPSIVKVDSLWHMFYTGVKRGTEPNQSDNEQRIMRSTSSDLYTWSDPIFVLDGTSPLTSWGSGDPWTNDCRDPDVFLLNEDLGLWGMVVSLKQADQQSMIIGWAMSTDLLNWTITSVVEQTGTAYWDYFHDGRTTWRFAESPQYLKHEGVAYLFWTPNDGTCPIIQFDGPTYSRQGGKACEILSKGDGTYWYAYLTNSSSLGFDIKIETMYFEDGQPWFQE